MAGPTIVTGAVGFAGSHLVQLLAADGIDTVAWHRPGRLAHAPIDHVRWHGVDMRDRQGVADAIAAIKPAVVYHCAGAAHVGQSWGTAAETLSINVLGTHHLVDALRSHAPSARLLITSSATVYQESDEAIDESHPLVPGSPYGLSKLAQELVGRGNNDHPPALIARPFNHIGPRQSAAFVSAAFARQIAEIEAGLKPPVIEVGNLEARRDLTDVRDVVRAYRLIAERGEPGRPYNVCTGTALAVRDVLDLLVSRARVAVHIVANPSRFRQNDTPVVRGSAARIRDELGWTPTIAFTRTVDDLLDYWRSQVRTT